MMRFVRSWLCAAALGLATLASGAALADPVTDAEAVWRTIVARNGAESDAALVAEWDLALALTNAGRLAEAEPHWRTMAEAADRLFPEDAELGGQIQIQLAMNVIRQGRYAEGAGIAERALPGATAALGADSELVQLGQAALATAWMMLGDYARAEAPARAAFEAARARGDGGKAGPYAMLLQQVLRNLGRDAEAQAVMAQTDASGGEYSSRQQILTTYREAGDWPRLAASARRFAADWRMAAEGGDSLAASLAQEAEIDLALALTGIAREGGEADFDEAMAAIRRVQRERAATGGWSLSRALNVEAGIWLGWPGHEDALRARELKGLALTALEADVGADHPDALRQRLGYGVLLLFEDPVQAAPVLAVYYDAALRGLVPPDDWAAAATLLATVLAEGGEIEGGYRLAARAADGLRDYLRAPARSEDGGRILRENDALFRTQVQLAWGLSESLKPTP